MYRIYMLVNGKLHLWGEYVRKGNALYYFEEAGSHGTWHLVGGGETLVKVDGVIQEGEKRDERN